MITIFIKKLKVPWEGKSWSCIILDTETKKYVCRTRKTYQEAKWAYHQILPVYKNELTQFRPGFIHLHEELEYRRIMDENIFGGK